MGEAVSDSWSTPPTEDEIKAAGGGWDTPPTPEEMGGGAAVSPPNTRQAPAIDGVPLEPLPVEDVERERDARVQFLLEEAVRSDPDKKLRAYELARLSGAPVKVVEDFLPDFERARREAQVDARKWRVENPTLDFILREYPELAPTITQTETVRQFTVDTNRPPLLWGSEFFGEDITEKQVKRTYADKRDLSYGAAVADKAAYTHRQNEIAVASFGQMMRDLRGWDTEEARRGREDILQRKRDLGPPGLYGAGAVGQLGLDVVQGVTSSESSLLSLALGGAVLAATKSPAMARLAASSMAAGTTLALESGGTYADLVDAVDAKGDRVDHRVAAVGALLYGVASTGVELGTMFVPLGPFKGLGDAIRAGEGRAWMRAAMADKTKGELLRSLAAHIAKSSAAEGGTEGVQEAMAVVAEWAATQKKPEDIAERVLESTRIGALAGGAMASPGVLLHAWKARAADVSAARGGAQVAAIAKLAGSDVAAKAPEALAALIEHETKQSGQDVTHLYLDPVAISDLAKKNNADVREFATKLLGDDGPKRLMEARIEAGEMQEGGFSRAVLEVPVKEFLGRFGGTDLAVQIQDDIAVRPGMPTMREQKLMQASIADLAKGLLEREEAEGDAGDSELDPGPSEREFIDGITTRLRSLGIYDQAEIRYITSLQRAAQRTLAKRGGLAAEEVFANAAIVVAHENATIMGQSPEVRYLSTRAEAMTREERGRLLFIDPNAEVLSQRGFASLPPTPGRDLVAHYSVEGTKWFNNESHDKGNLLYRLAGQALRAVAEDAARWGGDFASSVATEDEARANAAAVQATIKAKLLEMNPALADKLEGLQVTVSTAPRGSDVVAAMNAAGEANAAQKAALEGPEDVVGERAKRGERPFGIPAEKPGDVALPGDAAPHRVVPDALLAHVDGLTPEQVFSQGYVHPLTGLLTREAFAELQRKDPREHVATLDLRGLKAINKKYGEAKGDEVLQGFADAVRLAGGGALRATHLSGDEFALAGQDKAELEHFVDVLAELLHTVTETDENGRPIHAEAFIYGLGSDLDSADKAAERRKRLERVRPGAEARARAQRALHRWRPGVSEGRSGRARGDKAPSYAGVRERAGSGLRETRAVIAARRAVLELRKQALALGSPKEVAAALRKIDSPESEAAGAIVAQRLVKPAPAFASKASAYSDVVYASFPGGLPVGAIEDSRYTAALEGRGPMPGPFGGEGDGTFDVVNEELGLKTPGERVKSPRHAFELAMAYKQGTRVQKAKFAIELLRQVPGLEGLRMPDEYIEAEASDRFQRQMEEDYDEQQRAADAEAAGDASFDFGANAPEGELFQPAWHGTPHRGKGGAAPPRRFYRIQPAGLGLGGHHSRTSNSDELDRPARGLHVFEEPWQTMKTDAPLWRYGDEVVVLEAPRSWANGDVEGVSVDPDEAAVVARVPAGKWVKAWQDATGDESPGLSRDLDNPSVVSVVLSSLGIAPQDTETLYQGGQVKSATGNRGTFDADDPSILRQPDPADPEGPDGNRGWVKLLRQGSRRLFAVLFREHSDLSTALHESAHIFFEVLGDMAEHPRANDQIKADWAATLEWLGATDRHALTVDQKEKFARGFEAYLMEGRAPSEDLAEAFAATRLWLTRIYKTGAALKVELQPEVRGVFDRMLATDAEIKRATDAAGITKPLPRSQIEAGLEPGQYEVYLRERSRSLGAASARAHRAIMEAELRAAKAFQGSEFRRFKDQAADEYRRRMDVRAWRFVRVGETVLEDGRVLKSKDAGKMSRDKVRELLGAEKSALEKSLSGRLVAKGGLHPSEVAREFGFPTGRAMLEALAALPEEKDYTEERARELMREAHPEIDGEVARLDKVVQESLHAGGTLDWLLKEWAALKRQLVRVSNPETGKDVSISSKRLGEAQRLVEVPMEAIREAAREIVAGRQLGRLDARRALQTEAQAAERAALAAAKGEYKRAAIEKQRQILWHHVYRELTQATQDRTSLEELAAKLSKDKARERLGKASPAHRDVVDTILETLGFSPPRQQDVPRHGIDALRMAMAASGDEMPFDADALAQLLAKPPVAQALPGRAAPPPWKALTYAQARLVRDALANIKQHATNLNTAILEGLRLEKEAVIEHLENEARASDLTKPRGPLPSSKAAAGLVRAGFSLASGLDGMLLRPETMVGWLGNESHLSWWHRAIVKPLQAAKAHENDILQKAVKPILDAFDSVPESVRSRLNEEIDGRALFPGHSTGFIEIEAPTRRYELLMLALNRGNASNLERLLGGRNITLAQVDRALATLTAEELAWVQSVWDAAESLWPMIRELEERDTGIAPQRIPPTPFSVALADGREVKMRGGYFPAVYDERATQVGKRQEGAALADLFDPTYSRPSTSHSFTKKRAKTFADVIALEPQSIQAHFVKVAHDLAFRQAVRSVGGLLLDKRVHGVLVEQLGAERAEVFVQWVKDVGRMEGADASPHEKGPAGLMRKLKGNIVIGAMGYAIDNFVADPLAVLTVPFNTEVKAKHVASALRHVWWRGGGKLMDFAAEQSGEVRTRRSRLRDEFAGHVRDMTSGKAGRAVRTMQEHAFDVAEWFDKVTTAVIWTAAHNQALAEGRADPVGFADQALRQVMPAHALVDKAAIQRSKGPLGSVTMLYGYFSTLYQMDRRNWQKVLAADGFGAKAQTLPKALGPWIATLLVTRVLAEAWVGKGPTPDDGDDEIEKWLTWTLRKSLIGIVAPVPLMGGIVEQWWRGSGASQRTSPILSLVEQMGRAAKAAKDNEDPLDAFWQVAKASGMLLGIPTRPMRTLEYVTNYAQGDVENEGPGGVASGLVYGERRNQPETFPLFLEIMAE